MRKVFIAAAIAAAGLALYYAGSELKGYADEVVEFVRTHQQFALPVIALLAFGESIAFVSLVLPFWGILVTLGVLLPQAGVAVIPIWVAASVGAALGDWFSYWLGVHYHEQIGRVWPLSRHPEFIPRAHALFERWGIFAIWLGRFSGPLRATVPIVAGAVQMSPWRFQFANWGSAFLWAAVLLGLGNGTLHVFERLRDLL